MKRSLPEDVRGDLKLVYALTPLSLCCSSTPPDGVPEEFFDQMIVPYVSMKTLREPKLDTPAWRARIRRRAIQWYRFFLRELKDVDLLVMWSGFPVPLAAAAAAAKQLGKRVAFCENGVLPGTIAIDPVGVNYRCSLTGKEADFYESFPYDEAAAEKLFATVWPQRPLHTAGLRQGNVVGDENTPLPANYVLYAMQVNDDSQIRLFSPRFRNMEESVTYTYRQLQEYNRHAKEPLTLVVKEHPSDFGRVDYSRLRASMPDAVFLRSTPIRDLIKHAKLVIAINSSVAVEALFSNLPVLTLGQAFYNVKGLVRHLEADEELADILPTLLSDPIDYRLRKHFLCFMWEHYLVLHPGKHAIGIVKARERLMDMLEDRLAWYPGGGRKGSQLPGKPLHIACFHLNQIGDLLFSLPALYNLRARYPKVHITGITRPACKDLLLLSGMVDDVIERPGGSLIDSVRLGLQIRRKPFDLMLLFSTSPSAWIVGHLSGSKVKAGFDHDIPGIGLQCRVPWSFPASTENNLRMIEAIGSPVAKRDYVGLISPGDAELSEADRLLDSVGVPEGEPIAVLSPATSRGREIKRWPDKCCAEVADALKEQFGLTPVIVGMQGDADGISGTSRHARDITGRTSLPVLAGVIARSRMMIGTDSGVMHLAGAVGVPVIALFGPTDHAITGPQGVHRIVRLDLPCAPCRANKCGIGRPCMEGITPEMVIRAVRDLGEDCRAD